MPTLNSKIEDAWLEYRKAMPEGQTAMRQFETRFCHLAADQFDTSIERVRQRIRKIERRDRPENQHVVEAVDAALGEVFARVEAANLSDRCELVVLRIVRDVRDGR